jgi:predicted hotdog family 3-hydroxylacyl-ACP dehydratase
MRESEMDAAENLPAPVAGLIPHRRPVRLVETLLAANPGGGRAEARISADSMFATQDGRLDPAVHLELIAQTFAAVKGWRERHRNTPPQTGYLAGAKDVSLNGTAGLGDPLIVTMAEDDAFDPFIRVKGQVHLGDRCLARGRLTLWLEPPGSMPASAIRFGAETPATPTMPLDRAMGDAATHPLEWESDHAVTQSFCFPADFAAFQGHFPGNPVLPAFAQIRTVVYVLTSALRTRRVLDSLEKARFREPLRPGQVAQVRCRLENSPDACRASATLIHDDRPLSSFQITTREIATTHSG